jgi:hypothetical protein
LNIEHAHTPIFTGLLEIEAFNRLNILNNHPGLKATPPDQEGSLKTNHPVSRSGCHPSFSKEGSFCVHFYLGIRRSFEVIYSPFLSNPGVIPDMKFLPAILLIFLTLSVNSLAGGDEWRPVTQAELDMKTPKVEPGADAEAIFWEVRLDDSKINEISRLNYVRVKIFTERGREKFRKYEVEYNKGNSVKDIEARVTRPDGSTSFLKKEDIFEKDVVKADGYKRKAKSFAMPGLEIGSILEFRYREVMNFGNLLAIRLIFQRSIPIQTISYYVRPQYNRAAMYAHKFNMGDAWFEDDEKGFKRVTMNSVPAFEREPYMLPDDEVRSWMYVYYSGTQNIKKPVEYWKHYSAGWHEVWKGAVKPNDDIKQTVTGLIEGAGTDDEKLKKIYAFTQNQIRNLDYPPDATTDELKRIEGGKSPADTLKLKMGDSGQVLNLFAAMARAAGFDARMAYTGDREELFFDPNVANTNLIVAFRLVAVKVGTDWKFYCPSSLSVPYGMVDLRLENQTAMITDPEEPIWRVIPLSRPEKSVCLRTGTFKLLADGTLEGDAKIEYTGHLAAFYRRIYRGLSAPEREKTLQTYVRKLISETTELVASKVDLLENDTKSVVFTFKVQAPNFASRTGKRLFFQPNIFERNSKPFFNESARKNEIFFMHPWRVFDDLTIEFPDGYTLESADAPAPVGDSAGIARQETRIYLHKNGKMMNYKQGFSFGDGGRIQFPAANYPALRAMFEAFYKSNTHQLTLREGS